MARIGGVNIPDEKRVIISLTYIFGIGNTKSAKIVEGLGIDPSTRVKDLTEQEMNKIREEISSNHNTEGDLQRVVSGNVKRLRDIQSYRGTRHKNGLPSRGQRTRTNGRTKRGKRVAVGGAQPKAATKT